MGLTLIASPAAAKGLNPDDAAEQRATIEAGLSADARLAVQQLTLEAEQSGDPELFLLGARKARDLAAETRDTEMAEIAETLAFTARDIGFYLGDGDNYEATNWRPVTSERAEAIGSEAALIATEARELIDEIEAERAAEAEAQRLAGLEEDQGKEKKPMAPGTGMIIGGSAALVVGLGGVGMMGGGLAMGASAQRGVEALVLPQELDQVAEFDRQGSTANVLAIAGGITAAVGIGVGAALIAVGVKKRKAGGGAQEDSGLANVQVGGWALGGSAGLTIAGSF